MNDKESKLLHEVDNAIKLLQFEHTELLELTDNGTIGREAYKSILLIREVVKDLYITSDKLVTVLR